MTIIADASSLILLAKVSVLEEFSRRNTIVIPKSVYEEVINGKEKGRLDSLLVENLTQNNLLKIKTPERRVKNRIENLFNIKKGELDVIALAYKTKDTVLSDDKKCFNTAKVLSIGFITSLDVVVVLCKKGHITKEKLHECLERLEEYGWYSKNIIKMYRGCLKL